VPAATFTAFEAQNDLLREARDVFQEVSKAMQALGGPAATETAAR
jgi:hypothetical protein